VLYTESGLRYWSSESTNPQAYFLNLDNCKSEYNVGRDAQFNMAVCTLEGWGVSRQRRKAAKWMRMAAKAGDGQAAVLLSTLQTPLVANQVVHFVNVFLPHRHPTRDFVALLLGDVFSCLLISHSCLGFRI
jgi:TPR repeat protein